MKAIKEFIRTISYVFYPTNKLMFILRILFMPIIIPYALIRFILKLVLKVLMFLLVGLSNFIKLLRGRLYGISMKYF